MKKYQFLYSATLKSINYFSKSCDKTCNCSNESYHEILYIESCHEIFHLFLCQP